MTRIAVAQIESSTDKSVNLKSAQALVKQAKSKRADIVAFPEFLMAFSPASQSAEDLALMAESVDGPFIASLRETAKDSALAVIATVYECSAVANRVFDTAVWIDAHGNIASTYRKLHLYDAFGFKESDKFHPGENVAPLVPAGRNQVGMMICYDLRFPEMARMLTLAGADILIAPSGWVQGDLKLDHWQTMIRARALENSCYVVAPDQAGNIYIGHSLVVDPLGRTLVDLGEKEDMAIVELDTNLIRETREKLPLLANRRTDVYAKHGYNLKRP